MNRTGLGFVLGSCALVFAATGFAARVTLEPTADGAWQLRRDGQPYEIRGAGGYTRLELLRDLGGNTIRTWSVEQLGPDDTGEPLLDHAARLGLSVLVGLWVDHPRHGHDYSDEATLQSQRDRIRAAVRRYKDHPAVLLWGLGNEMEGDGRDPRVWRELEVLARIVKEEDPDHPVCTVLAGAGDDKVRSMMAHYTALDLLGVNIYGGAAKLDASLAEQGWNRPYLVTEFGPIGHWEVPTTAWGAPIEPSAAAKATSYAAAQETLMHGGRGLCLGTFCFIWGQKQETTATWFGMFLPTGEKTPTVDVMAHAWTGTTVAHPCPTIRDLVADFRATRVAPGSIHTVQATLDAPDNDPLTFDWQVVAETHDRKFGGDAEAVPPTIPGCVLDQTGYEATIRVPAQTGAYRVFLYVRNSRGGGAAHNFPFYVE